MRGAFCVLPQMCRRLSLMATSAAAIWLKVSMQLVGSFRELQVYLVVACRHLCRRARAVVAGDKAKTKCLRAIANNIVDFPLPEGRSVSDHHSGVGLPSAASQQGRFLPVAGPNRAQDTSPTAEGGVGEAVSRGRPGSSSLPEWYLTLLPLCRSGQLAHTTTRIRGSSRPRTVKVRIPVREFLSGVGVCTAEHSHCRKVEIIVLLGLRAT